MGGRAARVLLEQCCLLRNGVASRCEWSLARRARARSERYRERLEAPLPAGRARRRARGHAAVRSGGERPDPVQRARQPHLAPVELGGARAPVANGDAAGRGEPEQQRARDAVEDRGVVGDGPERVVLPPQEARVRALEQAALAVGEQRLAGAVAGRLGAQGAEPLEVRPLAPGRAAGGRAVEDPCHRLGLARRRGAHVHVQRAVRAQLDAREPAAGLRHRGLDPRAGRARVEPGRGAAAREALPMAVEPARATILDEPGLDDGDLVEGVGGRRTHPGCDCPAPWRGAEPGGRPPGFPPPARPPPGASPGRRAPPPPPPPPNPPPPPPPPPPGPRGHAHSYAPRDDGVLGTAGAPPPRPGNAVDILVDGAQALPEIERAIRGARRHVHIAGWSITPHFAVTRDEPPVVVRELLADAAERVDVRVLMWAGAPPHTFAPDRRAVRDAREELMRGTKVRAACDSRSRALHCHHEKLVIVDDEVAFVGGIDLTQLGGDRYDTNAHPARGRLGWHDASSRLRGPAVADVAAHFTARWSEVTGEPVAAPPAQPLAPAGDVEAQVVRTVPERQYAFLPRGDFRILEASLRALRWGERLVSLECQFLWAPEVVALLAGKLRAPPHDDFRVIVVLPSRANNG